VLPHPAVFPDFDIVSGVIFRLMRMMVQFLRRILRLRLQLL
jgi:hypothetical protein